MLPSGLKILKSSPAEDKDTLTVTSDTASKYDLKTIDDLKPVASKLILGAGPEFKTRYQGVVGLDKVYGLTFKSFKSLDPGGPLTKAALKKDQIQVANIFSTDSTITTDNLVVLDDTKNLFLAQNVTPVLTKSKVKGDVESTRRRGVRRADHRGPHEVPRRGRRRQEELRRRRQGVPLRQQPRLTSSRV